jgi:hypothetical protein
MASDDGKRHYYVSDNKGRLTLWPSKSRGCWIEWPNFVESPKKWVENNQSNIGIGAFGWA